jgi:lipopolysaccharide/colanic/teichoic acid biosynthesis glycosyltransferase
MEPSSTKPYAGKRALDVLVAGAACAAFAPLVAGIAVATWLEDSGSPLFAQSRVGRLIALSFAVNLAGKGKVRGWLA